MKTQSLKIFGWHAAEAAVKYTPDKILAVWVNPKKSGERENQFRQTVQNLRIRTQFVENGFLDKLSDRENHQGVVVEVEFPREGDDKALKLAVTQSSQSAFYLILDQIQDPHNLGACFRTADAAGVQAIIVTKDRSARLSPTVYKVASGAVQTVPIYRVTNLVRTMQWLKTQGIWLVGANGAAPQTAFECDLTLPVAIIVGAEGKGLRRLTREHCDFLINLPMLGQVESLNLSVATGVLLYEALRQRMGLAHG